MSADRNATKIELDMHNCPKVLYVNKGPPVARFCVRQKYT